MYYGGHDTNNTHFRNADPTIALMDFYGDSSIFFFLRLKFLKYFPGRVATRSLSFRLIKTNYCRPPPRQGRLTHQRF